MDDVTSGRDAHIFGNESQESGVDRPKRKEPKGGLCTTWLSGMADQFLNSNVEGVTQSLESLSVNQGSSDMSRPPVFKIPIYFRPRSSFVAPNDVTIPWVLVGAGAGIAPFRGFLQHRMYLLSSQPNDVAPCWMFFGCRNEKFDFLYRNEMEGMVRDGVCDRLVCAFSRDGDSVVYVQHRMAQYGSDIYDMIVRRGGKFFLCGYVFLKIIII